MFKYVYTNRPKIEIQTNKRHPSPIIHNMFSFYTQVLIQFHKANLVSTNLSNKIFNIQFNEISQSTKINSSSDTMNLSSPSHSKNTMIFYDIENPTSAET